MLRPLAAMVLLALVSACTTYHDQLARGQRAYDANENGRALAILRDIELDQRRLSPEEQGQYAFLRGMADYRIGYRADARHWLSLARTFDEATPGVLPPDAKQRTNEALEELNGLVYSAGGTFALTSSSKSANRDGDPKSGPARPSKKGSPSKKDEP
jgi:hypothetical protein